MSYKTFEQPFAENIYKARYAHEGEEWPDTAKRVASIVLGAVGYTTESDEYKRIYQLILERKFLPGGRYLYATGREFHQTQNCLLLRCEDTREGWAGLSYKAEMALMTGAGIGVVYSDLREAGAPIKKTGGVSSGPVPKMGQINELGRHVMQGGNRRSAIWAGLHWWHPDIFDFIKIKDWIPEVRALKEKDFTFPATMDMTNISVILDTEFFEAYHNWDHEKHDLAHKVYTATLNKMLTTAEPGFSIDAFENEGESLRNACTEVTSYDDSDVCNLGSLNLAAFDNIDQFASAVNDATLFLLAGTEYSMVPYDKVNEVRAKNRRLGLGVMGVHEWLLKRGKRYGPDDQLGAWMDEYARSTEYSLGWATKHNLSAPIKTRAIAPNGTIGIIAETTTSAEPIYAVAFKRRVYSTNGSDTKVTHEYVVDPTAKRLIDQGVDPDTIEDAHELAQDVERRISMQAWLQQYVDHGISSTINLPEPISDRKEQAEFGAILMKYLPKLRGITCYPEGQRAGQPLTRVDLSEALGQEGVVYEEDESKCVGGVCAL